jgi:hypothetical protein
MTAHPQSHAAADAPAPLPSAEALARALTGLATRLSELMNRETELVQSGRSGEIGVMQSEKRDLARAYSGRFAQLKSAEAAARTLPAELLHALRLQAGRLEIATRANEKALRIAEKATNRVIGVIAGAMREQRAAISGYDERRARPRRPSNILGMTCDRSL